MKMPKTALKKQKSTEKALRYIFISFLLLLSSSFAYADSWGDPKASIHATKNGQYGLKIIPTFKQKKAKAVLFLLDENGKIVVLKKWKLINTPTRAVILGGWPAIYILTFNNWANIGYTNSMVIYRVYHYGPVSKKKLIRSLSLEEILPKQEIKEQVRHSISSRLWESKTKFTYHNLHGKKSFVQIIFPWGRRVKVQLNSGKVNFGPAPISKRAIPAKFILKEIRKNKKQKAPHKIRLIKPIPPQKTKTTK